MKITSTRANPRLTRIKTHTTIGGLRHYSYRTDGQGFDIKAAIDDRAFNFQLTREEAIELVEALTRNLAQTAKQEG